MKEKNKHRRKVINKYNTNHPDFPSDSLFYRSPTSLSVRQSLSSVLVRRTCIQSYLNKPILGPYFFFVFTRFCEFIFINLRKKILAKHRKSNKPTSNR